MSLLLLLAGAGVGGAPPAPPERPGGAPRRRPRKAAVNTGYFPHAFVPAPVVVAVAVTLAETTALVEGDPLTASAEWTARSTLRPVRGGVAGAPLARVRAVRNPRLLDLLRVFWMASS